MQKLQAAIRPTFPIRNEAEYDRAVARLNELLDEEGMDEAHPLYNLLGMVIQAYEEQQYAMPEVGGAEMLRFFMEDHGSKQADLPEVGSQGVVSEISSGKRELSIRQIRALAQRSHVSSAVFV